MQYRRGRKDGLVCLFRNDLPWFIQEWDANQLLDEYLVKQGSTGLTSVPAKQLAGGDASELDGARSRLSQIETDMEEGERNLRQALREEDKRLRRQRASVSSVRKRQSMLDNVAARRAANAANMSSMWRSALRRSGF